MSDSTMKLTCKVSKRPIYGSEDTMDGYDVFQGDKAICHISKCPSEREWFAWNFDLEGEALTVGDTKKELLVQVQGLLAEGTLYMDVDAVHAKRAVESTGLSASINVTDEMIECMFVSALEGGSNYWYMLLDSSIEAIRSKVSRDSESCLSVAIWQAIKLGASVPIFDAEDPYEEEAPLGEVNLSSVKKAIQLMGRTQQSHLLDIVNGTDDAITGDVFFQLAVMQEVTFG